jgi:type II secretory pathway component GspD/PulD (secretin)
MKLIRLALTAVLAGVALQCVAQHALEIIPLRHTTVDQVLPTLRPLLEPGGTLTGQQGQLIVRASPANVAEIRRALEAIDRASRSLQILVRFDDSGDFARQAIGASGSVGNRGSDVEVRVQDSRASRDERVDQRIRVLEGSRAYISTGQSRPVMQRRAIQTPVGPVGQDTFEVQDAVTGFEVVPRVSGNRVFVDIAPQRQSFDSRGGVQDRQVTSRLTTSASGRLGEWFELGAIAGSGARDDRGLASASRSGSSQSRRIWVKVEETGN